VFDQTTEIGRALAEVDWAATPLGPVDSWSESLRNAVRTHLASRFAMWMAWGPELTFFCNDAYRRGTLAAKYPWALGKRADEVWSEIWPDIGPRIKAVTTEGISTWDESLLLLVERSGYPEESYHTFSYSPLTDDHGRIAGMLCVVTEETSRVISERRMATLRDLGSALAAASTSAEICAAAGRQIGRDDVGIPFALGYLLSDDGRTAELAWRSGVPAGHRLAPGSIPVDAVDGIWPVAQALDGEEVIVEGLDAHPDTPTGAWAEPPQEALVLPLTEATGRARLGFVVAGLNRYRALDADKLGYIRLIVSQVAQALTRAKAFDDERRRAEELAELDRAKTTFFTNVSHELRTPLTLLLGPAGDALDDADDPLSPKQQQRVEVIQRNAERLLKLVNTLLDFSRLQSGRATARFEHVDLARYTAELAAMFDSAVQRAGLTLTVVAEPLPDDPWVDREMWAKVVLNLLSNAMKATFTGGITVRLGPSNDPSAGAGAGVELSVTDTGVGIPADEQTRLFERFHRVSGAQLRSHEGTGIGLALVAELTALHGGAVSVESEPGVGSTFRIRVPLGTAHLPADQVVDAGGTTPVAVDAISAGYLAEIDRWLSGEQGTPVRAVDGDRADVLVVDDNADMREYVVALLQGDYNVRTAADGQEAIESARADPPDLVLTDVMMPRLDGFGLLQQLRADPVLMHLPVVMLSARSGDEAASVGLEAGADDYLVKPFSARELQARVRANLELDRVRRVADELHRSRALLDQAEELAHVGSWEYDLENRQLIASPELCRILGETVEREGHPDIDLLLARIPSVHRTRLRETFAEPGSTERPLDIELPIRRPGDASERILRLHARRHTTATGVVVLRGSAQDVTDQRAAEEALAASAAAKQAAAREHAIAEELQRSLLPGAMPPMDDLIVAAYYVSGVEDTQAGGDWYDVVDLGGGRAALVIGDVMGRGVRAAAVMGQLRATVRAYARLDLAPDALLELLDVAVQEMAESTIVTCVYAVCDPAAGTLTYGNAGHLPPLVTRPDGTTLRLGAGDPPLGTGRAGRTTDTVEWTPGSRLFLYTDGLVEHRGSDLDAGIESLRDVLDTVDVPVEALPNAVVAALLPHDPDDDVAVLTAAFRRSGERERVLVIAQRSQAIAGARATTSAALTDWGITGPVVDDVMLIVSELVTNAVRHGKPPIRLHLRHCDEGLVVTVADGSPAEPEVRDSDREVPNGRGLHLVAALSNQWGTRPTGLGKAVWCTVPLEPAAAAGQAATATG
jgi:signal transduction histidine kinase/serine phosphatase RsbU (regulator of sigma subunit)/DNA-binding response OmpR family regulator/anti-sigma regulatory factor (Ser/Thr protein kinase)